MIDRRELFRNALGAAAGVVAPSLWLPSLVAPKPAAAAAGTDRHSGHTYTRVDREQFFTSIPYQAEEFYGIECELMWLWHRSLVPATIVITLRQFTDLVRWSTRRAGYIEADFHHFPLPDRHWNLDGEAIRGMRYSACRHPVTGESVNIHIRGEEPGRAMGWADEIWFTSQSRESLITDGI